MTELHLNDLCFNPFVVAPLPAASGWKVVATSNELEHTHRKTFTSHPAARRFAAKVLSALDRGRDLDLRFWSTVELTEEPSVTI